MSPKTALRQELEALGARAREVLEAVPREIGKADAVLEEARQQRDRRADTRGGGRRVGDPPERMLTVAHAVRYLAAHGIKVHENTVRHWYQSGRIQVVREPTDMTPRGRCAEIWIPIATLQKIVDCPYCSSR